MPEHTLAVRPSTASFHPLVWTCSCGRSGSADSETDAERKFSQHAPGRPTPERCPACRSRRLDYQPMLDGTMTVVCMKCRSEWSGYDQ